MREKQFYIEEISAILKRFDSDSVKAVYNAIKNLEKGDHLNGSKKKNN